MSTEPVLPSNCLVLSSPSPPAFNLSQHQGLFQWVIDCSITFHILHQHKSSNLQRLRTYNFSGIIPLNCPLYYLKVYLHPTCPFTPFQKQKLSSSSVVTPWTWTILCGLFLGVGLCTALLSYISSLLHPVCLSPPAIRYRLVLPIASLSSATSHSVSFMARLGQERHVHRLLPTSPPSGQSFPLAATDFFKPDLIISCQFSFFLVFVQHLTILTTLFSYYFGPFWVLEYYFPVSPPLPIK